MRQWPADLGAVLVVAALGAGALLCGCDGCGGSPTPQAPHSLEAELGPLPEGVPIPGATYRQAYDQAAAEITPDNARDRLRQLGRDIARERRDEP